MTRELLVSFLAVVIRLNVGIIAYVIVSQAADEDDPPGRDS